MIPAGITLSPIEHLKASISDPDTHNEALEERFKELLDRPDPTTIDETELADLVQHLGERRPEVLLTITGFLAEKDLDGYN